MMRFEVAIGSRYGSRWSVRHVHAETEDEAFQIIEDHEAAADREIMFLHTLRIVDENTEQEPTALHTPRPSWIRRRDL